MSFELALGYVPPRGEWLKVCAAVLAGASFAAVIVLLSAQIFSRQVPLSLSLREQAGQLRIGWSPVAAQGATLEILDGNRRTSMVVAAPLSDVTYAVTSSDVQVRLTPATAEGKMEVARYVVQEPSVAQLEAQFVALLADAHALQRVIDRQNRRISGLESAARRLNGRAGRTVKPEKAPPAVTRWWR